jgi:hypothetical protein
LRAAEVTMLKVHDVDSKLRVERGKKADAIAMRACSLTLLLFCTCGGRLLAASSGSCTPNGWPGMHYIKPLSAGQLDRIVVVAAEPAGIKEPLHS